LAARAMPFSMASSKLLFELEIISVTLAIDTCRLLGENKLFSLPRTHTPAKAKTVRICLHQGGCVVSNVSARCACLFRYSISSPASASVPT
jgi:hypothetical protein